MTTNNNMYQEIRGTKVVTIEKQYKTVIKRENYFVDVPALQHDWSFTHKEVRYYEYEVQVPVYVVIDERDATESEMFIGMTEDEMEQMFDDAMKNII